MSGESRDSGRSGTLSPDEAFRVLGNDLRILILQTLGEVGEPLSFTELRNRTGHRQGENFNYHLTKLVGHFVRKTDAGYVLRTPGKRVVEAVLSGAVTEDPTVAPTESNFGCPICGAPVEVSYGQERLELYCTDCAGHFGETAKTRESRIPGKDGHLGGMPLPPAGVRDRDADELLTTASAWGHFEFMALSHDICPRCAAVVEPSVQICDDHDGSNGLCPACDRSYAVQVTTRCTNCINEQNGPFVNYLQGELALRRFVAAHGIDPIIDGVEWGSDYVEDIVSTDPFEARFTFSIDGDAITLTVVDDLTVSDVTHNPPVDVGE